MGFADGIGQPIPSLVEREGQDMFNKRSNEGRTTVLETILAGGGKTISVLSEAMQIAGQSEPSRLVVFHGSDLDNPQWMTERDLNWYRTGRLDQRKK